MINYTQLDPVQKNHIEKLLQILLKALKLDFFYRVLAVNGHLFIRESTLHSPPSYYEDRLAKMIELINKKGLISFTRRELIVSPSHRPETNIHVTAYRVDEINADLIAFGRDNKPLGVDEKTWAVISPEIKTRWDRFSKPLQEHIIKCMVENLEDKYNQLLTTRVLGETLRSPIGLEAPTIPVRLPNAVLGSSKEIYDLIEILNLRERNPANPGQRRNPITREFFDLNQVIPAPDALNELKLRAQAHIPRPHP